MFRPVVRSGAGRADKVHGPRALRDGTERSVRSGRGTALRLCNGNKKKIVAAIKINCLAIAAKLVPYLNIVI